MKPTETKNGLASEAASIGAVKNAGSSVGRVFSVLDLFGEARPFIRVDEAATLLGLTVATAYRYLKALIGAGLIAPAGGGRYVLGPRATELDRLMQLTDPLLRSGRIVMPGLLAHASDGALLLCRLYGETVLCVHHEGPSAIAYKGTSVAISRPRGLPFPLFSGAASLVILAHLPGHRIKSLYVRHHAEVAGLGLGADWATFRKHLLLIRKSGYAFSAGTLNPLLGGVAVPIFAEPDGYIVGSLSQVMPSALLTPQRQTEVASKLRRAATDISLRMVDSESGLKKTARATRLGEGRSAKGAGHLSKLRKR